MAFPNLPPRDDDVILVIPLGARRTGKLRLPSEVALWLATQLREALDLPRERKPRRPCRLHRGQWTQALRERRP